MAGKPSYCLLILFLLPLLLPAQQVNYSSYIGLPNPGNFRVIGRSGGYYWIEKEQIRKRWDRHEPVFLTELQGFAAYDERLNPAAEILALSIPGTIRQYLVAGKKFFDRLTLTAAPGRTDIFITRYNVQEAAGRSRLVDSIPFSAPGSRFLLLRSEDLSKTLLIGFETSGDLPALHTILFDADWHVLYHTVLQHPYFSQPCIQDDDIAFPAESFDNLPVKLADNGDWLMAAPSRTNRNYLFFHIYNDGKSFYYREIPLSPFYSMEDIAMSVDNPNQTMSIGLLSGYRNTSLKNVEVTRYSLAQTRFEFDSSYHFNTLAGRLGNQSLSNASFVAIPGEGFMLFKEYGRSVDTRDQQPLQVEPGDPVFLLAGFSGSDLSTRLSPDGYAYRKGLQGIRSIFNRGNLSMFYFPLNRKDSTWSGIINSAQTTELNLPALSYLVFPVRDKVYILYNSLLRNADEFSTTTALDLQGRPTGDALIFWKMNRIMDFQQSRRISEAEVAVPFRNGHGAMGFAVIRMAGN
jgi:hypothetical protein